MQASAFDCATPKSQSQLVRLVHAAYASSTFEPPPPTLEVMSRLRLSRARSSAGYRRPVSHLCTKKMGHRCHSWDLYDGVFHFWDTHQLSHTINFEVCTIHTNHDRKRKGCCYSSTLHTEILYVTLAAACAVEAVDLAESALCSTLMSATHHVRGCIKTRYEITKTSMIAVVT